MLKFDRERRRFIGYRNNAADLESLAYNHVLSLFEDREGNIWAGLGGIGPNRFASKPPAFQKFPYGLGNPQSKGEAFVAAIYEDRQGILWIGTREALNRIDRNAGKYTFYRTSEPGIGSDVISIVEDRSRVLWVGTFNHGLHRFDRRTGRFKTFRHDAADPYSLSNDIVSRVLVDHNGTLWAATWDGLNRFDATTERFITYKLDPQVKNLFYLELVEDPQGVLWLGTHSSGLHRFNPATGQFTVYEHQLSRPGTLSDNRVNSVHFDRFGAMWVGTQNGLNRFDPKMGTFTVYSKRDGLPGNAIGCVLEDERGDLWISTNNGVSRFNPLRKTFQNYSTADGLPGPDLTGWGAGFRSSSGEMFFGGFSGATAFHPDRVVDSFYFPPIVLTDFRLSGNAVEIGAGSPLKKSISYASGLALSHEQNVFSFTFAALSYVNPATNRYRYKLEGLDREWNEVGSDRRLATYTTLLAGRYTFRATGRHRERRLGRSRRGAAYRDPTTLVERLVVSPFVRAGWRHCNAEFLSRPAAWADQSAECSLRRTARRADAYRPGTARHPAAGFPQCFHATPCRSRSSGDGFAGKAALRPCPSTHGPGHPGGPQRRSRSALFSWRLVRSGTAFSRIPQELAIGEPIDFRIVVEGRPRPLHPIIRDEVYRIGHEALLNAFRHSQAKSIEVQLEHTAKHLGLLVRDNGRGIDAQVLQQGREGHWGLSGMRERAEKMGARLHVRSRATLGTEVELSVPSHIAFQLPSSYRPL